MHDTAPAARSDRVELAGIFVGGASTRWGGMPKGLLQLASGETLVGRWRTLFDSLGIETVLVGQHPSYATLGLDCVADEPAGIGPLGGLVGLLARADGRRVVAVACDMPYVSRSRPSSGSALGCIPCRACSMRFTPNRSSSARWSSSSFVTGTAHTTCEVGLHRHIADERLLESARVGQKSETKRREKTRAIS